jgi:hypothetical protein
MIKINNFPQHLTRNFITNLYPQINGEAGTRRQSYTHQNILSFRNEVGNG